MVLVSLLMAVPVCIDRMMMMRTREYTLRELANLIDCVCLLDRSARVEEIDVEVSFNEQFEAYKCILSKF